MSVARMAATLGACLLCGCNNITDVGTVQVQLWQPATLSGGEDGTLLADATGSDVTVIVDGQATTQSFAAGEDIDLSSLEAAPEGSEVVVEVRTTGDALPNAYGRTEAFWVGENIAEAAVLVLAPPRQAHLLVDGAPNRRQDPAICASTTGEVLVLGGVQGTTLTPGSFVLDRAERAVREGPALPRGRQQFGCAVDENGSVYLAGGCDGEGTPRFELERSEGTEAGASFEVLGDELLAARNPCGSVVTASGEVVVVQYDDRVEWRATDGNVLAAHDLFSTRFFATAASVEGTSFVAGGVTTLDGTVAAAGTVKIDPDGSLTELAGSGPLTQHAGRVFQVSNTGSVIELYPDNVTVITAVEADVPPGFAAARLAKSGETFAVLNPEGDRVYLIDAEGTTTVTVPGGAERPGGHIVAGPGGALFLVGGNLAGVHVVRPEAA